MYFEKITSRETAFDSYKLPMRNKKATKDMQDTGTWRNTSSTTLNTTSKTGLLNHSINFGKQSARFKTQRSKNGAVRVLTLYTPNYESVCKRSTGKFDFGRSEGREDSAKRGKTSVKVHLSEGIRKLMLEKANKNERKPNFFALQA